jgi:hypothetical protein
MGSRPLRWVKHGLIFEPDGSLEWAKAYAWVPTVDWIGGNLYRVYFAGRNRDNLSQTGYFTIDITKPHVILDVSERPVVELGPLGTFDDSAVVPTGVVTHRGQKWLYYTGWMQGKRVPYYASVGLAISDDGGRTFRKYSRAPLFDRDEVDAYMTGSAYVLVEDGTWRMWYFSNTGWVQNGSDPQPYYHIRYAESSDGIRWRRDGTVCIDFKDENEYAIARPWVLRDEHGYRMWYSCRGTTYRIGYAESADGVTWTRRDADAGIDVSATGWDSEMIEYACVFEHDGVAYMLYNGNTYGKAGVGLAVAE